MKFILDEKWKLVETSWIFISFINSKDMIWEIERGLNFKPFILYL